MSFFSEVAARLGLGELKLAGGYNVINYNGEAVYLEGVKRLLAIEEDLISLQLSGAKALIRGISLRIHELSGTIIIKGEVTSMEFTKDIKSRGKNKDIDISSEAKS